MALQEGIHQVACGSLLIRFYQPTSVWSARLWDSRSAFFLAFLLSFYEKWREKFTVFVTGSPPKEVLMQIRATNIKNHVTVDLPPLELHNSG